MASPGARTHTKVSKKGTGARTPLLFKHEKKARANSSLYSRFLRKEIGPGERISVLSFSHQTRIDFTSLSSLVIVLARGADFGQRMGRTERPTGRSGGWKFSFPLSFVPVVEKSYRSRARKNPRACGAEICARRSTRQRELSAVIILR